MNNHPPLAPKDRRQLPDPPQTQRAQAVQQSPMVASRPVPPTGSVSASQIPGFSLQVGLPTVAISDVNALNKLVQLGGNVTALLAPTQPKLDPINLLGAVAAQHQQQQMQNVDILRSLMEQKQQISKYEDEIRRRMMLPPSDPMLQAHLYNYAQGSPFFGGIGLLGNMGSFNPTLTSTLAQLSSTSDLALKEEGRTLRGGVIEPFPERLHRLLLEQEAAGHADIISFVANGRAFMMHQPERFFKEIIPQYFRHKRLSSFKRQLNLYGFELITTGPARGGYYHKYFVKDNPELLRKMRRSVTSKAQSKSREARPKLNHDVPSPSGPKDAHPNDNEDKVQESDQKCPAPVQAQPEPR